MLVNMSAASGNFTVTEYFQLSRYGQVVLSATDAATDQTGTDARLDQYTQFFAPSVSGYATYLANIAKRRIYLDDGSTVQNPDPIIFGRGGNPLSASNTLRGGDQVASITAVLDERFEGYRLQTQTGSDANFIASNPRPATPPAVGGTLRAASFNVLNYFNTFGTANFTNCGGASIGGRGAANSSEFTRQSDKIVNAIITSGADVMGLNEMQNNGFGSSSAIQDLVTKLNNVAGAGSFTFVNSGCISTDAITVAIIYKPAKVTPVGASAAIPLTYGTGAFNAVGRGSLAQTFQQNSTGAIFTLVANHWKSKGSSAGGAGDTDTNDGQAASNGTRTRQAQDVVSWLNTKPTGTTDPDYLIVGDLNAYAKEDPLTTLESGGYTNVVPNTTYSYVFDGFVGALDHGLRSASLQSQIAGADKWHINADEPTALDYNTEFKSTGQIASLYSSEPYRASDHDPVLIGLNLTAPVTALTLVASANPTTILTTGTTTLSATVTGGSTPYSYTFSGPGTITPSGNTAAVSGLTTGTQTFTVIARDATSPTAQTISQTVSVTVNAPAPVCPTYTAVLTTTSAGTICAGTSVTINFGVPTGSAQPTRPYSFTYSDGTTTTVGTATDNSGTSFAVSPTANTTYTLLAVKDAAGCPATTIGIPVSIVVNQPPTVANAGSSQSIPQGTYPQLSANTPTVGTGAWSASIPGTFGSVSSPATSFTPTNAAASLSGSYTVTWIISNGVCPPSSSSATITIVPAGTLTVTLTANPITILTTGTTTLSATASSGTPGYTYTFSGPGTITPNGNTATVSGLTAGVQTFTVVARDATLPTSQTASQTVSVTVNAPAPVCPTYTAALTSATTAPVCAGTSVTINFGVPTGSAQPTRPYSFTYSDGTTTTVGTATDNSGTSFAVSPTANTTYTLLAVKDAAGCPATTIGIPVSIVVNQPPTVANAGSSQSIPQGTYPQLSANTPTVGTGAWSASIPGTFGSVSSPATSFTPTNAAASLSGSYTVTWIISNGVCPPSSSSATITIVPAGTLTVTLTANPTTILTTGTTTLSATASSGTPGYTYTFSGPGTITPNGNTATVSGLTAGVQTFTVVARDATLPTSQTASQTVTVTVNAVPVVPTALSLVVSATPTTILTTGTTTLSATVSGGTPGYTYTFSGPGTITPNGNTATVSGLTAGVQTFMVVARDATLPTAQSVSQTVSVTVNAAPVTPAPRIDLLVTTVRTFLSTTQSDTKIGFPYSVSGVSLPGNVTVTVSGPFKISFGSGNFTDNLVLPVTNGTLPNQLFVLALTTSTPGVYAGTATFSSGGTTASLPMSGTVLQATLTANPTALNGLVTTVGTPSAIQSYTLTTLNETGITVTAPAGVEIRTGSNAFGASLTIPASVTNMFGQTDGLTSAVQIDARLTGVVTGPVTGPITNTATRLSATATVNGTVNATTTPPATGMLSATVLSYNCTTGDLILGSTGGNGSQVLYSIPGITGPTANANQNIPAGVRRDGSEITIQIQQTGGNGTPFTFNFRNFCQNGGQPTPTPPTTTGIPNQVATVGTAYSLNLAPFFASTNGTLSFVATGLPAGLSLTSGTISGTPSTSGVNTVTIRATDASSLSVSTAFTFTVNPVGTTPPVTSGTLSATVLSYNCTTGDLILGSIGGNGSTVMYAIPGITGFTTNPNQNIPEGVRRDGSSITIQIQQTGGNGTPFTFNFRNFCQNGGQPTPVPTPTPTPTPPASVPFSATVLSYNCQTGALVVGNIGAPGSGSVEYAIPGLTNYTTDANFMLNIGQLRDASTITINVRQGGVQGTPFTFNFRNFCQSQGARQSVSVEPVSELTITILGNPTSGEAVVEIRGAEGQALGLRLADMSGRLLESRQVPVAGAIERQRFDLSHQAPGVLLLQVSRGAALKTVKISKQ